MHTTPDKASEVTLREYYGRKADRGGMPVGTQHPDIPQQQRLPTTQAAAAQAASSGHDRRSRSTAPTRPSAASKLLARLSPGKAGGKAASRRQPASHGACSSAVNPLPGPKQPSFTAQLSNTAAAGAIDSSDIPAFRPPSPTCSRRYVSSPDGSSPSKAQLQAVRSLGQRQQASPCQERQSQQQVLPQQLTPGYSESNSVGRAINAQIASSIEHMFMATPPEVSSGLEAAAVVAPPRSAGSGMLPGGAASGIDQRRQQHGGRGSIDDGCSADHSEQGTDGTSSPTPAPQRSTSPFAHLPMPPPQPVKLRTAMTDSGGLEPQSVLSPVFMSVKHRAMYCELDDIDRSIVFPKARRHRTGRIHRFVATMFGCFVPPPSSRSPAPSMRTPGGRRTPSSQGGSPLWPKLAYKVEPLRQSLAGLALHDPELRQQLRASLAAAGGSSGLAAAGQSPPFSDLLGLQDEQQHMNLASPVLPSRPASQNPSLCATPAGRGLACGDSEEEQPYGSGSDGGDEAPAQVLAKRNLMDVLRSKETGTVQQQYGHVHAKQQQRQACTRKQAAETVPEEEEVEEEAHAKATHVSLAQLLVAPAGPQLRAGGHTPLHPRQVAQLAEGGGGHHNSGAKRGREVLGVSRGSSDAAGFTPKLARRDLSKPSYRSEALHLMLSPMRGGGGDNGGSAAPNAVAVRGGTHEQVPLFDAGAARAARAFASAPASPLRIAHPAPTAAAAGAAAVALRGAGGYRQSGGSAPASPLTRLPQGGPRLNRAAVVRASASQRKLQEREAHNNAYMSRSPNRHLRAAAAEGLSLRAAAVLASPGKSARPHYHPSPAAARGLPLVRQRQPGAPASVAAAAAAGLRNGTPGGSRFDAFAAGEAGVEPYSARLHTAERRRPGRPAPAAVASAAAPQAVAAAVALEDGLDFARLAADRDAYLQMLQRLAEGLQVDRSQIEAHKHPTRPQLPAGLLAGAAAQGRRERMLPQADGADTVRPRTDSQEAVGSGRIAGSTDTLRYSLNGEASGESWGSADEVGGQHGAVLTPHHNLLFGRDATPTNSSPVAQQRMVSMTAAATVQQHHQREQREQPQPSNGSRQATSMNGPSSASRSISFGSGGCMQTAGSEPEASTSHADEPGACGGVVQRRAIQPPVAKSGRHTAAACDRPAPAAADAAPRGMDGLLALLETQSLGGQQRLGVREVEAAGYTTQDLHELKQWLARQ